MSIASALLRLRPVLGVLIRSACYIAIAASLMVLRPLPPASIETPPTAEPLPDVLELIRQTQTSQTLQRAIDQAFAEQDFASVRSYQSLAIATGIKLDHVRIASELDTGDTLLNNALQNSENFLQGAVFGEGDSIAHLAGSATADLLVVGDIRDLIIASDHYLVGEEVDYFTASLSAIGLVTSVVAVASSGTATSLDISLSTLKTAKKAGHISEHLAKTITKQVDDALNIKAMFNTIREVNTRDVFFFEKPALLKQELTALVKRADPAKLESLKGLAKSVEAIAENTGSLRKTMLILKQADTAEELEKFAKLSKRFPDSSDSIVKILGKRAIKAFILPSVSALYYAAHIGYWSICQLAWLIAAIVPLMLGRYWSAVSLLIVVGAYGWMDIAMIYTWLQSMASLP